METNLWMTNRDPLRDFESKMEQSQSVDEVNLRRDIISKKPVCISRPFLDA